MDDSMIVDLYLRRDENAIEHTAARFGGRLRALAHSIVRDVYTAEECENDTYMEAWDSIPPHEQRTYLYAFLARITRHIALNRCRDRNRLKRKVHILELDAEMEQCLPSPDDTDCLLDDMELSRAINGFLSSLDAEKRNIFVRRYWYLDTVADIAERFSLSQSKVKMTLSRCRERMREYLEKEGYVL